MRNMLLFLILCLLPIPITRVFADEAAHQYYVRLSETGELDADNFLQELQQFDGVTQAYRFSSRFPEVDFSSFDRWLILEYSSEQTLPGHLLSDPRIELIEEAPERHTCVRELDSPCNDPLFPFQWHLDAVSAVSAWDLVPDASEVTIAIVDVGVQLDHPDLRNVLWENEREKNGTTLVDDDGNGFVDDIHGYDFVAEDGDPSPGGRDDHGTHCAGIAAAEHDNALGITGIAPGARIMTVRSGSGNSITFGFEGILYAVLNGAEVISLSWGGYTNSLLEQDVVRYALENGAILLAAAGNDGRSTPYYPAAYEGVLAVAATTSAGRLWGNSNHGDWVDIAAPGYQIYSTVLDGYNYRSGTSMATPLVAGIAALVLAESPALPPGSVIQRLTQSSGRVIDMPGGTILNGLVNAYRASISSRPTVVLNHVEITDENENGLIEPGERIQLDLELELMGGAADNITFTLLENDLSDHTIRGLESRQLMDQLPGTILLQGMAANVDASAERGSHPLGLAIHVDEYRDTLTFPVPVSPPWRTHQAGNMVASVTDFGAIGYNDYLNYRELPDGVRLREHPQGFLFHGSILASDGNIVSDCSYGSTNNDRYDFYTLPGQEIHSVRQDPDHQVFQSGYTDALQPTDNLNLEIHQETHSNPEDGNFVIFSLTVSSLGGGLNQLYLGVFCDWDIPAYGNNQVDFDAENRLSYMTGEQGAGGIAWLDESPVSGVRAINNGEYFYGQQLFSDQVKAEMMLGGTAFTSSDQPGDWSHIIAVDLGTLPYGTPITTRFALVAGESLQDLQQAVEQARAFLHLQLAGNPGQHPAMMPARLTLEPAFPNPFNAEVSFGLNSPVSAEMNVEILDLLGRRVRLIHSGSFQAGRRVFLWNGTSDQATPVASGVYFIHAGNSMGSIERRILLLR